MNLHDPDYCPQLPDVSRRGYRATFTHVDCLASRSPGEGVKCHGIFGSGDKTQVTNNKQIGASEDAVLDYAENSNIAKGGLLGLTQSSVGNVALGGVSLGGANSGQITINGNAGVEDATKKFSDVLNTVAQSSNETVASALEKVSALSESKQTDGISSLGKIALSGLGITVAGAVVYFITRKSK
jgi:hypothetical protein